MNKEKFQSAYNRLQGVFDYLEKFEESPTFSYKDAVRIALKVRKKIEEETEK